MRTVSGLGRVENISLSVPQHMQTFVARVCTQCQCAPRFLRKNRGRGAKALDNQNSMFVARKLSLRRCFRVACNFGKHLTLRPVPGLLLQSPGQGSPKRCAWLTFQHLRAITGVMDTVVLSNPPSWPHRERQSVKSDLSSISKLSPGCTPECHRR